VGVLMLVLIVVCSSANGNRCSAVGVVSVGVRLDGVAAATGAGVEGAGGVGDAVAVGIGVWEVGGIGSDNVGVDDAASTAAVGIGIVEYIGIAVDRLQGQQGVSDVGSMVKDEGVC